VVDLRDNLPLSLPYSSIAAFLLLFGLQHEVPGDKLDGRYACRPAPGWLLQRLADHPLAALAEGEQGGAARGQQAGGGQRWAAPGQAGSAAAAAAAAAGGRGAGLPGAARGRCSSAPRCLPGRRVAQLMLEAGSIPEGEMGYYQVAAGFQRQHFWDIVTYKVAMALCEQQRRPLACCPPGQGCCGPSPPAAPRPLALCSLLGCPQQQTERR
jgi:hypothetical protein